MEDRQLTAYERVQDYIVQNPDMTISGACRHLGINISNYYNSKARVTAKKKIQRKPDMVITSTPMPATIRRAGKITVFVGDPATIAEMFNL